MRSPLRQAGSVETAGPPTLSTETITAPVYMQLRQRRCLLLLASSILSLLAAAAAGPSRSAAAAAAAAAPDISLDLRSPAATPVTHEATGLLNNLPQDSHGPMPVLRPLKMTNYRGLGSLDSYQVLADLGTVKHSQVLLFMEWCWYWAPGNTTASRCTAEHMPGAGGNWSGWEDRLRSVVQRKLALRRQTPNGPAIWWDIWSAFPSSLCAHTDVSLNCSVRADVYLTAIYATTHDTCR
eukprot:COSAG06_NODE_4948_length_3839_cov_3.741979_2_plen_238_part_00